MAPPELHEAARVRVQLFDSFGDGWDGLQLVVSPLSSAASEASFTLSPGLSSTTASLSLPLGCHQLQMMHQGGHTHRQVPCMRKYALETSPGADCENMRSAKIILSPYVSDLAGGASPVPSLSRRSAQTQTASVRSGDPSLRYHKITLCSLFAARVQ